MPPKNIPSIGAIMKKKIPAVPDIQPNNILKGPQLIMSVTNQLMKKIKKNVFHFFNSRTFWPGVKQHWKCSIYNRGKLFFLFYLNAATANRVVCAM